MHEFQHEAVLRQVAAVCEYDARRMAEHFGISPRHLQRLFKAHLQRSPRDWLREQRLLRAREMLPTAGSVKHVAYTLRFQQVSQFSRDFKVQFGYRPSTDLPASVNCARRSRGRPA